MGLAGAVDRLAESSRLGHQVSSVKHLMEVTLMSGAKRQSQYLSTMQCACSAQSANEIMPHQTGYPPGQGVEPQSVVC